MTPDIDLITVQRVQLLRDAPMPLHSQLSDAFRQRIASGEWPPHYRLKAEPEFAADLGVSRGTLRRALTTLIDESLLRQVQGKGTYVTSTLLEPAIAQRLSTLSEDFVSQGINTTTIVLASELTDAPIPVSRLLDIGPRQRVLRLRRLHETARGPVALTVNYVRVDLAPGLEEFDFAGHSLFQVLEADYGLQINAGRRTFSAVSATAETAELLALTAGDPVQYLEQITYLASGQPIEYSDVWINSSKAQVTSILARQ